MFLKGRWVEDILIYSLIQTALILHLIKKEVAFFLSDTFAIIIRRIVRNVNAARGENAVIALTAVE